MGYKIGDIFMYDKKVLRTTSCWRCRYRGEYEWRESGYPYGFGEKISTQKMFCKKTRRWGSTKRACFCTRFESNSDSYVDPAISEQTKGDAHAAKKE